MYIHTSLFFAGNAYRYAILDIIIDFKKRFREASCWNQTYFSPVALIICFQSSLEPPFELRFIREYLTDHLDLTCFWVNMVNVLRAFWLAYGLKCLKSQLTRNPLVITTSWKRNIWCDLCDVCYLFVSNGSVTVISAKTGILQGTNISSFKGSWKDDFSLP